MSADHSTEIWKPICGCPHYEVSNMGRVRSLYGTPHLLKLSVGVRRKIASGHFPGYLLVSLAEDGKIKKCYVHALVLEAFVGPRPDGMECLHGDGGPLDNRLVNLSYGTRSKNLKDDRARDGTDNRGEKHPLHKLTTEDVQEMRRQFAAGIPQVEIARSFCINQSAVSRICNGKRWGWLAN